MTVCFFVVFLCFWGLFVNDSITRTHAHTRAHTQANIWMCCTVWVSRYGKTLRCLMGNSKERAAEIHDTQLHTHCLSLYAMRLQSVSVQLLLIDVDVCRVCLLSISPSFVCDSGFVILTDEWCFWNGRVNAECCRTSIVVTCVRNRSKHWCKGETGKIENVRRGLWVFWCFSMILCNEMYFKAIFCFVCASKPRIAQLWLFLIFQWCGQNGKVQQEKTFNKARSW